MASRRRTQPHPIRTLRQVLLRARRGSAAGGRPPRGRVRATLVTSTAAATLAAVLAPVWSPVAQAAPSPTVPEVQAQVSALNEEVSRITEYYNTSRVRLEEVQRTIAAAQDRVARQQAKVDALKKTLGGFANIQYRSAGMDQTLQLVFASDPKDFLARASALDAIGQRQSQQLARVVAEQQRLTQDRLQAAEAFAQLERARQQLAGQKADIEGKLAQAQALLDRLSADQRAQLERASRSAARQLLAAPASYTGPATGAAGAAVRFAYAQLGKPYQWGAAGPDSYDCSGLTMMAWRAGGVSLPHSSQAQWNSGPKVARADLQPGDLVFFYSDLSHVSLYVGNNQIIDAPRPGRQVEITSIDSMPYVGAVRP